MTVSLILGLVGRRIMMSQGSTGSSASISCQAPSEALTLTGSPKIRLRTLRATICA